MLNPPDLPVLPDNVDFSFSDRHYLTFGLFPNGFISIRPRPYWPLDRAPQENKTRAEFNSPLYRRNPKIHTAPKKAPRSESRQEQEQEDLRAKSAQVSQAIMQETSPHSLPDLTEVDMELSSNSESE
jgi:hypothetical protein